MKLVPITDLLDHARKNRYAVGGFNIFNLEMVNPILRAADTERSAVAIQVYSGDLENINGEYIAAMTGVAAQELSVPVALHLDHGASYEIAMKCIRWGFSSIMVDLSRSNFEENIKYTKKVVREAHKRGVSIEAELGEIYNGRDPVDKQKSSLTDITRAVRFVSETGVDALAVSIGTAHGVYTYGPDIDYKRLETLSKQLPVPIVVHGGSYIPDKAVIKMVQMGVAKINIGTELMFAFYEGLRDSVKKAEKDLFPRNVLDKAHKKVEELTIKKIRLFNTLRVK
ncbi:MAG: class II fructose-bisphosphate aldolase [Spirochaetota bacterium]|nr:MAG: class II fructose-bisphosphate aldolase [Spirochaetota bacterium]